MTLPVRLLPEARVEFDEATDRYERQRAGLGTTFVTRVRDVLHTSGPIRGATQRRVALTALV